MSAHSHGSSLLAMVLKRRGCAKEKSAWQQQGGQRLESWWNSCTQRKSPPCPSQIHPCQGGPPMPPMPLSPEKLADAKALAQAIRQATEAEIDELARTLVATDNSHPFGQTE